MSTGSIVTLLFYILFIGGGCIYTMYRTLGGGKNKKNNDAKTGGDLSE